MKPFVKTLRKNMTDAERRLWNRLQNRQLGGWKFRRQHPVGPFIVDFVCVEKRLIVEVDGGQHAERRHEDKERSRFLKEKGYRVLRFWNNQVLQETEAVLGAIFQSLSRDAPSPQPSPPQAGARG